MSDVASVLYFAYGSNMDPETLRGRRGIRWTRAFPARLRGWRLAVDKPSLLGTGEGMATIVADPESEVWGVVFEISAKDLEHLEFSEGVKIGHYERREVQLERADGGERIVARTLVSDERDASFRPSTRYMKLLIDGATEHGLPAEWIAALRAIEAFEETAEVASWRAFFDRGMGKPD